MAERIYGMHHIGITVPDIEQGIAFFEAVFGAVTVFRTGPFNVDEAFMQRKLGAAPHTRIRDLVFLRCGDGPSVELFEYSGEDSTARPKRVSEVGGTHLCFEVDDVFASAERLRAKGIEFLEIPTLSKRGRSPASTGSISIRPGASHWKSRAFPRSATKRARRNGCGGRRHSGRLRSTN